MKRKKSKENAPTGDNIQIKWEEYMAGGYVKQRSLILRVISLGFQTTVDDQWQGTWNEQLIWVKFTKLGWETIFSDNFPSEHKSAAIAEVRRITNQFN